MDADLCAVRMLRWLKNQEIHFFSLFSFLLLSTLGVVVRAGWRGARGRRRCRGGRRLDLSLELAVHPRPSYAPESRDLGIRHGHRGEEELMVDGASVSW